MVLALSEEVWHLMHTALLGFHVLKCSWQVLSRIFACLRVGPSLITVASTW